VIKTLNGKSLRTLGICYKNVYNVRELSGEPDAQGVYDVEKDNFTLLCVVGIRDVLRPTVKAVFYSFSPIIPFLVGKKMSRGRNPSQNGNRRQQRHRRGHRNRMRDNLRP
jgi:hypothetical protein